jgi:hypothetical protein
VPTVGIPTGSTVQEEEEEEEEEGKTSSLSLRTDSTQQPFEATSFVRILIFH